MLSEFGKRFSGLAIIVSDLWGGLGPLLLGPDFYNSGRSGTTGGGGSGLSTGAVLVSVGLEVTNIAGPGVVKLYAGSRLKSEEFAQFITFLQQILSFRFHILSVKQHCLSVSKGGVQAYVKFPIGLAQTCFKLAIVNACIMQELKLHAVFKNSFRFLIY